MTAIVRTPVVAGTGIRRHPQAPATPPLVIECRQRNNNHHHHKHSTTTATSCTNISNNGNGKNNAETPLSLVGSDGTGSSDSSDREEGKPQCCTLLPRSLTPYCFDDPLRRRPRPLENNNNFQPKRKQQKNNTLSLPEHQKSSAAAPTTPPPRRERSGLFRRNKHRITAALAGCTAVTTTESSPLLLEYPSTYTFSRSYTSKPFRLLSPAVSLALSCSSESFAASITGACASFYRPSSSKSKEEETSSYSSYYKYSKGYPLRDSFTVPSRNHHDTNDEGDGECTKICCPFSKTTQALLQRHRRRKQTKTMLMLLQKLRPAAAALLLTAASPSSTNNKNSATEETVSSVESNSNSSNKKETLTTSAQNKFGITKSNHLKNKDEGSVDDSQTKEARDDCCHENSNGKHCGASLSSSSFSLASSSSFSRTFRRKRTAAVIADQPMSSTGSFETASTDENESHVPEEDQSDRNSNTISDDESDTKCLDMDVEGTNECDIACSDDNATDLPDICEGDTRREDIQELYKYGRETPLNDTLLESYHFQSFEREETLQGLVQGAQDENQEELVQVQHSQETEQVEVGTTARDQPLAVEDPQVQAVQEESVPQAESSSPCSATGRQRSICWSDERGDKPLETVHYLEGDANDPHKMYLLPYSIRIVILLLYPQQRKFEFVQCELALEKNLRVKDILIQLPHMATNTLLRNQRYICLCRGEDELLNSLFWQEYQLREGEILWAVAKGSLPKKIRKDAVELLRHKDLLKAVKRAKLTGRALHQLLSSEELDVLRSEALAKTAAARADVLSGGRTGQQSPENNNERPFDEPEQDQRETGVERATGGEERYMEFNPFGAVIHEMNDSFVELQSSSWSFAQDDSHVERMLDQMIFGKSIIDEVCGEADVTCNDSQSAPGSSSVSNEQPRSQPSFRTKWERQDYHEKTTFATVCDHILGPEEECRLEEYYYHRDLSLPGLDESLDDSMDEDSDGQEVEEDDEVGLLRDLATSNSSSDDLLQSHRQERTISVARKRELVASTKYRFIAMNLSQRLFLPSTSASSSSYHRSSNGGSSSSSTNPATCLVRAATMPFSQARSQRRKMSPVTSAPSSPISAATSSKSSAISCADV